MTRQPKVLYQDDSRGLLIQSDHGADNELYGNVLRVRGQEKEFEHDNVERVAFDFDNDSTHYLLSHDSRPIGCLTGTRHQDGQVDCRDCYPASLLQQYGDQVVSFCKSRIAKNSIPGFQAFRLLVRAAWSDQLEHGTRIDLINVTWANRRVFERIGYHAIKNARFVHPTLQTDSVAMFLSADPTHDSFCKDLFESVANPILRRDVIRTLVQSEVA